MPHARSVGVPSLTTIILTSISIMLAALAALMVVFYGGDMLHGGGETAMADTYMNAGHNVIAASDQFRLDNRYDPPDFSALVEGGFVKGFPFMGRSVLTQEGGASRLTIDGVPPVVCAKINEILKRPAAEWSDSSSNANDGSGSMGCSMSGATGVYYALT